MKKLATAVTAIVLIGTPAFAADMPVKAPYAPAPAVYNWTGWYAGVNAGASFGNVKTDFNAAPSILAVDNGIRTFFSPIPGVAFSNTESPSGFMGGGQIGYNWQFSPIWVAGLEADFQGALERDSSNLNNLVSFNAVSASGTTGPLTAAVATGYTTNLEWFGTVRLRAGYVWGNGNVFSYLTGGLAYGKVDIEGTNTLSVLASANGVPLPSAIQAFGHSNVNTGWVVGYGTEGVIDFWGARNWTWKIEGLYMDLGHLDATGPGASSFFSAQGVSVTTTAGPVATHTHFTDGILRGGLNYKFN